MILSHTGSEFVAYEDRCLRFLIETSLCARTKTNALQCLCAIGLLTDPRIYVFGVREYAFSEL